MEQAQRSGNEDVELIADPAELTQRLEKLDLRNTVHHIYSWDAHQQLLAGVNVYADAETTMPAPERIGEIPVSQETYRQQRATTALNTMVNGGFVLRIFSRS